MREYLSKCKEVGKVCYDKKSALCAKNHRESRGEKELRIYECEFLGEDGKAHWHLTSHPCYYKKPMSKKNKFYLTEKQFIKKFKVKR